jgi:hypothetical protein
MTARADASPEAEQALHSFDPILAEARDARGSPNEWRWI